MSTHLSTAARPAEATCGTIGIGLLDRIVDGGRTVIVIEHNLDVVARADWVIDLGPGAGHDGGRVVFSGPPAELVRASGSLTGEHLSRRLRATSVA
jgi:excinuclease UvrABC ATPase subunit